MMRAHFTCSYTYEELNLHAAEMSQQANVCLLSLPDLLSNHLQATTTLTVNIC